MSGAVSQFRANVVEAKDLAENEKYGKALKTCKTLLGNLEDGSGPVAAAKVDPNGEISFNLKLLAGKCAFFLDHFEESEDYLNQVLLEKPKCMPALVLLSRLYRQVGKWEDLVAIKKIQISIAEAKGNKQKLDEFYSDLAKALEMVKSDTKVSCPKTEALKTWESLLELNIFGSVSKEDVLFHIIRLREKYIPHKDFDKLGKIYLMMLQINLEKKKLGCLKLFLTYLSLTWLHADEESVSEGVFNRIARTEAACENICNMLKQYLDKSDDITPVHSSEIQGDLAQTVLAAHAALLLLGEWKQLILTESAEAEAIETNIQGGDMQTVANRLLEYGRKYEQVNCFSWRSWAYFCKASKAGNDVYTSRVCSDMALLELKKCRDIREDFLKQLEGDDKSSSKTVKKKVLVIGQEGVESAEEKGESIRRKFILDFSRILTESSVDLLLNRSFSFLYYWQGTSASVGYAKVCSGVLLSAERGFRTATRFEFLLEASLNAIKDQFCCTAIRAAIACREYAKADKYFALCGELKQEKRDALSHLNLAFGDYWREYKEDVDQSILNYRECLKSGNNIEYMLAAKSGLVRSLLVKFRLTAEKHEIAEEINCLVADILSNAAGELPRIEFGDFLLEYYTIPFDRDLKSNRPNLLLPAYVRLSGLVAWECGNDQERAKAQQLMLKAAKYDPHSPEPFTILGHYYREIKNDVARAVKCYEKAFAMNNLTYDVFENLSIMYHDGQKDVLAAGLYRTVIGSLEDYVRRGVNVSSPEFLKIRLLAWLRLGQQQLENGKYTASKNSFQKVLSIAKKLTLFILNDDADPESKKLLLYLVTAHQGLGDSYLKLGQYTASIKIFEESFRLFEVSKIIPKLSPSKELLEARAYTLFKIGSVYVMLKENDTAIEYLVAASKLEKEIHGHVSAPVCWSKILALLQKSKELCLSGNFAEGMLVGKSGLNIIENDFHFRGVEAGNRECFWKLIGDYYSFVATSFPVPLQKDLTPDTTLFESCDQQSKNAYSKAVFCTPWNASLWYDIGAHCVRWRAQIQSVQGDDLGDPSSVYKVGHRVAECSLVLNPLDSDAWNLVGVLVPDGSIPENLNSVLLRQHCFSRSTQLQGENTSPAWCNLGILYENEKEYDLALLCYNESQSLPASEATSWTGRAQILARTKGETSKILAAHTCAFNLSPDGLDFDGLSSCLAYIRESVLTDRTLLKDELVAVVHATLKCVNRDPRNTMAYVVQGYAHEMLGNYSLAAFAYTTVIDLCADKARDFLVSAAHCLIKSGLPSEAVKLMEEHVFHRSNVSNKESEEEIVLYSMGLREIGRLEAALNLCLKFQENKGITSAVLVELYETYVTMGDFQKAKDMLHQMFEVNTGSFLLSLIQVDRICSAAACDRSLAELAISMFREKCSPGLLSVLLNIVDERVSATNVLSKSIFSSPWSQRGWFELSKNCVNNAVRDRTTSLEKCCLLADATQRTACAGICLDRHSSLARVGNILVVSSLIFLGENKRAEIAASKYLMLYPWDLQGHRLFAKCITEGGSNQKQEEITDSRVKFGVDLLAKICTLDKGKSIDMETPENVASRAADLLWLGKARFNAGENPESAFLDGIEVLTSCKETFMKYVVKHGSDTLLGLLKLNLARYYANINRKDNASQLYREVLNLISTDGGIWQEVGSHFENIGNQAAALHCYRIGSQMTDMASSKFFLGRCSGRIKLAIFLAHMDGYSKGLEVMGKTTKLWPNVAEANFVRGYMHSELKQSKASEFIRKAVELKPDLVEIAQKHF